jgi:hypothetical protein
VSVVYYIRAGGAGGLIKIGKASDPYQRMAQLQTGNGQMLTLLATEPGDLRVEHRRHRQFRALRQHGEWFRAEPALLLHVNALQAGWLPRDASWPWLLGRALAWLIVRCLSTVLAFGRGVRAGWCGQRVPSFDRHSARAPLDR